MTPTRMPPRRLRVRGPATEVRFRMQAKDTERLLALTKADIGRFWSKVQRGTPDECWPWTASDYRDGYGQFHAGGRSPKGRPLRANRVVAFLQYGPPPTPTHQALHHCDTPSCCNPSHIYWGTHADNMRDRSVRERLARGERQRGGRRSVMLTASDIERLRATYAAGGIRQVDLGATFGISQSAVSAITRREVWRHVP